MVSKLISVTETQPVLVTLTLSGSLTKGQITPEVETKLVTGVAGSLGIDSLLVKISTISNARRRLLAISVTLRILTIDSADAAALQSKAKSSAAAISFSLKASGLDFQDMSVSTANAADLGAAVISPANSESSSRGSTTNLIGPVAGGVAGLIFFLCLGAFWFVRRR